MCACLRAFARARVQGRVPSTKTVHICVKAASGGLHFSTVGTSLSEKPRRDACLQFMVFSFTGASLVRLGYRLRGAKAQRALVQMKSAMLRTSFAMLEAKA